MQSNLPWKREKTEADPGGEIGTKEQTTGSPQHGSSEGKNSSPGCTTDNTSLQSRPLGCSTEEKSSPVSPLDGDMDQNASPSSPPGGSTGPSLTEQEMKDLERQKLDKKLAEREMQRLESKKWHKRLAEVDPDSAKKIHPHAMRKIKR